MAKKKATKKKAARKATPETAAPATGKKPRYRARVPIHFPAQKDLARVQEAGGYPGLPEDEAAEIKGREKTLGPGKSADNLPDYVLQVALRNGWIIDADEEDT